LEWFGIFLPLAFHAFYGFYIWWRGESNVAAYPWTGNWMYTLQRYTGMIAFFYIIYHLYIMRFTGVHLPEYPGAAFGKVQNEFANGWPIAVYIVGIVAASWHFGYGLFLFAAKWGLVTGDKARKKMQIAGIGVAIVFIVIGFATMGAFFKYDRQPTDPAGSLQIEKGTQPNPNPTK
jgi:succinate dehydrogenase / fumarate reductase cytochrome b subunit